MKNLVRKNNDTFIVGTSDLWKGFGYNEHRTLRRVVSKHLEQFEDRGEIVSASVDAGTIQNGRPEIEFLLNERQFILLCLLVKNTPASVRIKCGIENEFSQLRSEVAKLSQADEQMLRLTRINPQCLKAITGSRNNNEVGRSYEALELAGIMESFIEWKSVKRWRFTPNGLNYCNGYHQGIPRFKDETHDNVMRMIDSVKQDNPQLSIF